MARDALSITAGPSKFDLMLSLFDGKEIKITAGQEFTVVMLVVEAEDGSRESWNFSGFVKGMRANVQGYYSTRRRQGHMFLKPH